jgi:lysophospholipase L1-like esterase
VDNFGKAGEWADDGSRRFGAAIDVVRPEVVILLEGHNDLAALGAAGLSRTVVAMETMVKTAKTSRADVILASLPPQRTGGDFKGLSDSLVTRYNTELRRLAQSQQTPFIDLYQAFLPEIAALIGRDGVHPTAAGYQRMAELVFAAIRAAYETSPAPSGGGQ